MTTGIFVDLPPAIRIRDVTLRDGLQSNSLILPTRSKLELYDVLVAAGVRDLQVTSFMNPARVPQLADAPEFWAALAGRAERRSVLVANMNGFERALAAGAREIEAVVSASASYQEKNAHRSVHQALDSISTMALQSREQGLKFTVALANCYHCVFEGWIDPAKVLGLVGDLVHMEVAEIVLCDTTGFATPDRVYSLSSDARSTFPEIVFGAHLHDTRGRGIANAIAAMLAGITWFDATLASLGGSPFAPGMGGNLSLEMLVDTLSSMDIKTGLDPKLVAKAGAFVRAIANRNSLL